mgnify:CR=1 FL=1
MKTKQLFLNAAVLIMAVSLSFTGCRPKQEPDNDTSGAQDNTLADKSFEDMGQISSEAASSGGVSSYKLAGYDGILSHCADLTFDTLNSNDADSITVDFGPTNCLCHDGRYRRGKLHITYSAGEKYLDSTAVITIKTAPTDNYFVNDNQVIGEKTITNKGHNSVGHMNWDIQVSGQIIKANNQGTITWTSTRNREWLAGETIPNTTWSDDVYGVTGSATGTSANGTPFSMNITSQLVRKISCIRWFVTGKFEFKPGNKPTRYVDFSPPSNGACDDEVWITINSTVYKVHMN